MIWLLSWHTREEVQTLATMLAGLSKMTVSQLVLQLSYYNKRLHFILLYSYWNFILTIRKMDRVRWWQSKHSQGGRHFETIWWRWATVLHVKWNMSWTILTQTSVCLYRWLAHGLYLPVQSPHGGIKELGRSGSTFLCHECNISFCAREWSW
jgi:hypothetical protein